MHAVIKFGLPAFAYFVADLVFADVTLQSRNMPTHCEFVYSVDSQIEIVWHFGEHDALLYYELFHEYDNAWEAPAEQPIRCNEEKTTHCRVSLAFQSMSTAEHYLFRKIRFRFVTPKGEPLSKRYLSSFGREFGERCYDSPDETPFRSREVFDELDFKF